METECTDLERAVNDGAAYWLGPVIQVHTIGPYSLLEYREKLLTGDTYYSIFIDGHSICRSERCLEAALAEAIAYRFDGCNSKAGRYFMKMIGAN
jgi:hypothetical protein